MSRLLGRKARITKLGGATPEAAGRAAFAAGVPISANPWPHATGDKGSGHAWERGWKRAQMAARKAA